MAEVFLMTSLLYTEHVLASRGRAEMSPVETARAAAPRSSKTSLRPPPPESSGSSISILLGGLVLAIIVLAGFLLLR